MMIPRKDARLCVNCDMIFDKHYRACPACGSDAFMPLSRYIKPAIMSDDDLDRLKELMK